ncbi:TIGR00153 family protein [Geoglobus acetivorans]|uniref:TIGR00153 family protein n=1 Tax=Geoglobus acetivorans TaxID=565033 RepID=A0ABZ3H364_GEOAI|nr:TIGR00153 family protein [Geoglobus acetivorans]
MRFVRSVADVFGYSPFEDLHRHAELCDRAVEKLMEQFRFSKNGECDKVRELEKEIDSMEYQADLIKQEIRANVTKSLLMPVDRQDLLNFLKMQDQIIDNCEHVTHMISYKILSANEEIWELLFELLSRVRETVKEYEKLVGHFKGLIESSFSKKEINEALDHVPAIEELEHRCDKIQIRLHRKIFNSESENVLDLILLNEIVVKLGEIANSTARAANTFRTMILGR